ncbi:TPA: hypothetical protein CPT94_06740 [Candidatus Gastranaerophilales bacterium HUM_22]|nr:MAG TPA: hypothetical protein CPT94_06740 [Candidatus Gastranaerophilales bacterium HUM_22]
MCEQIKISKIEHLKMIEDIITRMANNSFLVKGWTVTLIAALLIFADAKNNICFIWIAIIPIIVFWYLDSFYLQLERKYRQLYSFVQQDYINIVKPDYKEQVPLFNMSTENVKVTNIVRIMFSKSIIPIYSTILIVTLIIYFINC